MTGFHIYFINIYTTLSTILTYNSRIRVSIMSYVAYYRLSVREGFVALTLPVETKAVFISLLLLLTTYGSNNDKQNSLSVWY